MLPAAVLQSSCCTRTFSHVVSMCDHCVFLVRFVTEILMPNPRLLLQRCDNIFFGGEDGCGEEAEAEGGREVFNAVSHLV